MKRIAAIAVGITWGCVGLMVLGTHPADAALIYGPHGPGGTWNAYELVTTSVTWDQARVNALTRTHLGVPGHLATIQSAAENLAVQGAAVGNTAWIGLTDATQASTIDGFNPATALGAAEFGNTSGLAYPAAGQTPSSTAGNQRGEGWVWLDGSPVVFQNWGTNEPNDSGSEDAAQIRADGLWNDHRAGISLGSSSDQLQYWVVEYDTHLSNKPETPINARLDPIGGHYYEAFPEMNTWDEARVAAGQREVAGAKGHLATISDARENGVVNRFGAGDRWIGLTDATQASSLDGFDPTALGAQEFGNTSGQAYPPDGDRGRGFVWVTGEPVTFLQNWNTGEPNNSGNVEDAVNMTASGLWNDHRAGMTIGSSSNHYLSSVLEYDTRLFPFKYVERKASASFGTIDSLAEAKQLLSLPGGDPGIAAEARADVYAISFADPQNGNSALAGSLDMRLPFLLDTPADDQDFVVQATGLVHIPEGGEWTFAIAHDDYFELSVGPFTQPSGGCCGHPTLVHFNFADEGNYPLSLIWYERGGGADLQLFAAQGNRTAWDASAFALVGDVFNGGLALVPEPSSAVLALVGLAALAIFVRRRNR